MRLNTISTDCSLHALCAIESWGSVELVSIPFSQQNVRLVSNPYEQVKRLQNGGIGN